MRDTPLVHLVGRNDELHIRIGVHERQKNLLVGPPRRSGHEKTTAATKAFDRLHPLRRCGDLSHTVEARIARDDHVVEPDLGEQPFRFDVLHEQRVEGLQRLPPHGAVGTEEDRIAAENRRNDIRPHLAAPQFGEQVDPEFVFDENGDLGVDDVQKTAGVGGGVGRKVEDIIGTLVILADLIPRRGEEREQDLVFGMFRPQTFDDRTGLFELPQRSGMYPDDPVGGTDGGLHTFEYIPSAFAPQPGFSVPKSGQADASGIERNTQIIQPHALLSKVEFGKGNYFCVKTQITNCIPSPAP